MSSVMDMPTSSAGGGTPRSAISGTRASRRRSARTSLARRRGSWASDSRVASMWSAAVFDPAFPARSSRASGSPLPACPWSAHAVMGWNPNVFFQVGAASCFSEWAITIVASRSTVTSPPPRRARVPGQRPGPLPRRRPGRPDRLQRPRQVPGQLADQPGHHRVRRDRPRQLRLLPQHRDVGQAVTAQRHRRGQVRDDLARVVDRPRRPPPGQALRQAPAQAGDPHRLPQQDRPGLGDQPPAVSGHRNAGGACAILHLKSAFDS